MDAQAILKNRADRIEVAALAALAWMENPQPTAAEFAEAREGLRTALAMSLEETAAALT